MAALDTVWVKTESGKVAAVVLAQYDVDGVVTTTDNDVVTADLLLLGETNAKRTLVKDTVAISHADMDVNKFTFTDANS